MIFEVYLTFPLSYSFVFEQKHIEDHIEAIFRERRASLKKQEAVLTARSSTLPLLM